MQEVLAVQSDDAIEQGGSSCSTDDAATPRPTHEVPVYWKVPSDGSVATTDLRRLLNHTQKPEQAQDVLNLATPGACRPSELLKELDSTSLLPEEGIVHSVNITRTDLSGPTERPRGVDQMDLHDLVDLHNQIDEHRQQIPIDLVVVGKIHNVVQGMLVDSGSTISIISRTLWNALKRDNPGMTLLPTAATIRTASGDLMPAVGRVALEVELAGQHYLWLFYVLDSPEQVILGMDFLSWYNVQCDWRQGILLLHGREVKSKKHYSTGDGKVRRLTLVRPTQLPANSHCLVEARVITRGPGDLPDWGLTTPARKPISEHGVIAGRALVDAHARTVMVPVINPTESRVILPGHLTVAYMEPVAAVDAGTLADQRANADQPPEDEYLDVIPDDGPGASDDSEVIDSHDTAVSPTVGTGESLQAIVLDDNAQGPVLLSPIERLDCGCLRDEFHPMDRDDLLSDIDEPEPLTDEDRRLQAEAIRYGVPEHLRELYVDSAKQLETEAQRGQWAEFLDKYQDMFAKSAEDLGGTNIVQHRIDTGNRLPIRQAPRRIPLHKRAIAQAEIEKMLRKGVIEPCDGPWASPIVLVTKKGGDTRFCVDFRELNAATVKDAYPLPRIEDNLDALQGASWYSTLDLLSGFWQVEVAPEDRDKTAFAVPGQGLYRFVTMPFGLCNAPATFERLMERVLTGLQWTIAVLYIDDVIVFSDTVESHIDRLSQVMDRLLKAGLKLKPSKCQLLRHRVEFLGHIVSAEGVAVDPAKVEKVVNWPAPRTVSQLRSFLGLCTYYQNFIKDYSTVAKPLFQLTEKDQSWEWTSWHQHAFDELKKLLSTAPVLGYPRPEGLWILDTDASDVGLGAVLSQVQDGVERVIAFGSRTLRKPERNYCVTRRELLAIVSFVSYFRYYLIGTKFLCRTDHAALIWLLRKRDPVGQMARWITLLTEYEMCIEHRPGKKHGNADALSRCMEGCRDVDGWEFPAGHQTTLQNLQDQAQTHYTAVMTRSQAKKQQAEMDKEADLALDQLFKNNAEPDTDGSDTAGFDPADTAGPGPADTDPVAVKSPTTELTLSRGGDPTDIPASVDDRGVDTKETPSVSVDATDDDVQTDDDETHGLAMPPSVMDRPTLTPEQAQKLQAQLAHEQKLQQFLDSESPLSWTVEAIVYIQEHDPDLSVVRSWITNGKKPTWEKLAPENAAVKSWWNRFDELVISKENNILYIRWDADGPHKPPPYRIVAPRVMAPAIMREIHDSPTGAHLGQTKTGDKAKMSPFYWPGMVEYARRWVRCCNLCSSRKNPQHQKRSPLQQFYYGATGDRYSCDLCGPFSPPTRDGSRWILTVTDWFTRFMVAYSLRTATAERVAGKINNFITLFGCPLELYSDNGRNLHGEVMQALCKLLGVRKLATVPYRPSSNGITERENRVLKNCLSCFVDARGKDWDLWLDALCMGIRSSVHRTLNETPNMMMFARQLRLPLHSYLPLPPDLEPEPLPPSPYVAGLADALRQAHDAIVTHLGHRYRYQKKNYDKHVTPVDYQIGQAVWLRIYPRPLGRSRALLKYWDETWIVIDKISQVHYKIQKTPLGRSQIIHADRLKQHPGDIACAATKRLWLALQPDASRVDKLGLEKSAREKLGIKLD